MASELLRQVRILDPVTNQDRVTNVLLEAGQIVAMADVIPDLPEGSRDRDCQGLVLGTGLVDLYSQSGEPGFESRETLASLGRAAVAGGFTRLNLLPSTQPVLDNPAAIGQVLSKWAAIPMPGKPTLGCWGALTIASQGQQMTEFADLVATPGLAGFADGQPLKNLSLLRQALIYLQPIERPIALWACDTNLVNQGVAREGVESLRLGLAGNPAASETVALAALLELVATTQTPVHLMRISTARSVELIRQAKERNLPVTASASWMHLLLDVNVLHSYDPNCRLDPPLGRPCDRTALLQAVQEGVIDAIAIDHTPYTHEEKTVAFAEAPPGAIGLELALPLLWQTLVAPGHWTALELWRALSTRPAHCLGQTPATIAVGQPAELTLFDPAHAWIVSPQTLASSAANTPWLGQSIQGRIIQTWGG